jgi:hypothetical protein
MACEIAAAHCIAQRAPEMPAQRIRDDHQWRSSTQPTNAAHPANITKSINCPLRRARCLLCHAKSCTGSDWSELRSIIDMDVPTNAMTSY